MELSDLVGVHKLDAVDFSSENIQERYGESFEFCNVMRFRLDGIAYVCVEDPQDGYRSSMRELQIDHKAKMKNRFAPVRVVGVYKDKGHGYSDQCDILELVDEASGLVVIEVGTDNTDDYYPGFVSVFRPENMTHKEITPTSWPKKRRLRIRKSS